MLTTCNEWKPSRKGNHVCIQSGEIVATVYRGRSAWQIIVNRDGVGFSVAAEYFEDHEDGIDRADEILAGADCILVPISGLFGGSITSLKQ